jgi:hypothetical protein
MNDVTRILNAIEEGDPHAAEQLLPLVYDELRKLAAPGAMLSGPPSNCLLLQNHNRPRKHADPVMLLGRFTQLVACMISS